MTQTYLDQLLQLNRSDSHTQLDTVADPRVYAKLPSQELTITDGPEDIIKVRFRGFEE